jgi:hypothetical protein
MPQAYDIARGQNNTRTPSQPVIYLCFRRVSDDAVCVKHSNPFMCFDQMLNGYQWLCDISNVLHFSTLKSSRAARKDYVEISPPESEVQRINRRTMALGWAG